MIGFPRRWNYFPTAEEITQIEGIGIVDIDQPEIPTGAGTGTVACVGEFADMSMGVFVDNSGNVSTKPQPSYLTGTTDLANRFGGFDPSLGEFGGAMGSGFVSIRSKVYSRLVLVPVNLCSPKAVRLYRKLPTNTGATDPTPSVSMAASAVPASTEFLSGGNRVRSGKRIVFTGKGPYLSGVDGSVTAVATPATPASIISDAQEPLDLRTLGTPAFAVQFNAGGVQNFNVTAHRAKAAGSGASYPATGSFEIEFPSLAGSDLHQTVTITAAADAPDMADQINSQIVDGFAEVNGTEVDISADWQGSGGKFRISETDSTIGDIGIADGTIAPAGGSTVDCLAKVLIAELVAIASGVTNGSAVLFCNDPSPVTYSSKAGPFNLSGGDALSIVGPDGVTIAVVTLPTGAAVTAAQIKTAIQTALDGSTIDSTISVDVAGSVLEIIFNQGSGGVSCASATWATLGFSHSAVAGPNVNMKFLSTTTDTAGSATALNTGTANGALGGDFATNTVKHGAAAGSGVQTENDFNSAGSDFLASGVKAGDSIVIGVLGLSGVQGANADTYRVLGVASAHQMVVEKQDGSNFSFTTATGLVWRLHVASDADTGGPNPIQSPGGYTIPARPLDASVSSSTAMLPTVQAPAVSATAWDPLSGLTMQTDPNIGLVFQSSVQAPNAANSAQLNVLYQAAFDSLLSSDTPAVDVNILFAARRSSGIRTALKAHAIQAFAVGIGRICISGPELGVSDFNQVISNTDPGGGANRSESFWYTWPGFMQLVNEAVGIEIPTSDGNSTFDGILDVPADAIVASAASMLAPYRSIGQAAAPMDRVMLPVLGFARGTPDLTMQSYILMKAAGVIGLKYSGGNPRYVFQSSVTTDLTSGKTTCERRRMANFVEDSLQTLLDKQSKLPMDQGWMDDNHSILVNFGELLIDKRLGQQLKSYSVDVETMNTDDLEAQGIWIGLFKGRMLGIGNDIIIGVQVGQNVVVTTQQ